jgi:hypothetical protein
MAETKEADCLHGKIIQKYMAGKLILHVNRDSTAVETRQRVINNPSARIKRETATISDNTKKYGRGRPRKDDASRVKKPDIPEQQRVQSPEESIEKLECTYQWGCKINSQGNQPLWKNLQKMNTNRIF